MMTNAERQRRYRWSMTARAALEKAARLIMERPLDKELPLLPETLVKAYGLDKRTYKPKRA